MVHWGQQMTNSRKIKRNKEKEAQKEIKQKINMFSRMDDECLACTTAFDKTDRAQVESWYVVVKEEQKKVNLYCPDCWGKARQVVEAYYKGKENEQD